MNIDKNNKVDKDYMVDGSNSLSVPDGTSHDVGSKRKKTSNSEKRAKSSKRNLPSSQGGTHTSSQMYSQWQSSNQDEVMHDYSRQIKDKSNSLHKHMQHTSEIEPNQHNSGADGHQQQAVQICRQYPQRPPEMQVTQTPSAIREQGRIQNPANNVNHSGLRRINSQPTSGEHRSS